MEVAPVEGRGSSSEVDVHVIVAHHHGPEESVLPDAGIEIGDLCAPRTGGLIDVNSNESERRPPFVSIPAAEEALHEAHVVHHVGQRSRVTGPSVALLARATDQGCTHRTLEVENGPKISVRTAEDRRKLYVRRHPEKVGRSRDRLRQADAR